MTGHRIIDGSQRTWCCNMKRMVVWVSVAACACSIILDVSGPYQAGLDFARVSIGYGQKREHSLIKPSLLD